MSDTDRALRRPEPTAHQPPADEQRQVAKANRSRKVHAWQSWTHAWFVALERQAERVLGADLDDAEIEILFYVDALRNVVRGAEKILGRRHDAVVAFGQAAPDAKNIRDILEHFDEYAVGRGRRQKSGEIAPSLLVFHTSAGPDWHEIQINDERLEVKSSLEAAAALVRTAMDVEVSLEYQEASDAAPE